MTTAPTPEEVHALAARLEHCVAKWGKQNALSLEAYSAVKMMRRLQGDNERLRSAERTLQRLGYQDRGGQEWAPPIGKAPDFDLIDSLRSRIADLEAQLVAEARATAEHKLRADQLAQQHRMQAQMHAQATQQLAELEARKPLPPEALADVCEAWLQSGGASNIVDAFEAGYRAAEGITGGSS